jgi:pimeloyl-ACP methyl ester carboxylesterase
MTLRQDVTDRLTNRIHRLASVGAAAALLLVLVPTARSTAQGASAEAQKSCPKGAVSATIAGKRVCLKSGQKCKSSRDWQYHRYGFHCHTGRLVRAAKPKPSDAVSRKIDVGGYRLAITCRGKGSPTVILESGGGASAEAWFLLERIVAKTTRVCSYDRAGLGVSEPRRPPGPVPAGRVVEDLHSLLVGAGISPPYVLGGWSLGGFFSRLYTKRYPDEVIGLVAVDGTPIGLPGEPSWMKPPGQPPIDLIGGPGFPDSYYLAAADAELAAAPDLGSRPIVVLTHGRSDGIPVDFEALWLNWQKRVASLSTSSIPVRVDFAGHAIQSEAPDLTAEAFRQVIRAVRTGAPLPACAATPLPLLSGTCLDPSSPSTPRRRT